MSVFSIGVWFAVGLAEGIGIGALVAYRRGFRKGRRITVGMFREELTDKERQIVKMYNANRKRERKAALNARRANG